MSTNTEKFKRAGKTAEVSDDHLQRLKELNEALEDEKKKKSSSKDFYISIDEPSDDNDLEYDG